jgi:hypothetical protein
VQRYLTVARQAFPERDDAELVDEAGIICARLSDNPSTHDVVGDLAAQLGNQTQAQQLVEAATATYCRRPVSHGPGSAGAAPVEPAPFAKSMGPITPAARTAPRRH